MENVTTDKAIIQVMLNIPILTMTAMLALMDLSINDTMVVEEALPDEVLEVAIGIAGENWNMTGEELSKLLGAENIEFLKGQIVTIQEGLVNFLGDMNARI